jgi:hypothetical protein
MEQRCQRGNKNVNLKESLQSVFQSTQKYSKILKTRICIPVSRGIKNSEG